MITVSDATKRAIYAVWDAIAEDAYELCDGDNEIAIELVLDAGRLTMHGYEIRDREIGELVSVHGFESVRAALAKKIQLL